MLCSRQDVFVLPLKPLSIKYPAKNFGFRLFNESCGDCDVAGIREFDEVAVVETVCLCFAKGRLRLA
jgi:hypothetical protein